MDKTITYIITVVAVIALIVSAFGYITFEGQISDVNSSINNLETEISNIDVTSVQDDVDSIQGQLADIQDSITSYQSAISELETQVGEQQDKIDEYQQTIEEQQSQIDEYQQVTLVDMMGNVVTFTEPPERIVSFAPSNTELLFAIGAGDSVVGVTDFCNYPYDFSAWIDAGNMSSIGGYSITSAEPTVALEPDLILATSQSADVATNLKNLGYNVLFIEGHTIEEILQDILLVGRATYHNTEASALVTDMRSRIDAVVATVADAGTPKVYYELWNEPLMSAGPDTFIDEAIALAGGVNIFNDATTSWPVVSAEAVIEKNPDVIIFGEVYMSGNFGETKDSIKTRPGWDIISAVENDDLYDINDDIINRNGPRVADAIELIAAMVHPDLFG